jgi:hypothetical protein
MNPRKEYIQGAFGRYLDRRSVPQHIAGNAAARTDEMAALFRAVMKAAPESNYQEWWPRMEDAIDSIMRTRVWPTVNEVRAAARLVQKDGFSAKTSPVVQFDPVTINAKRIREGEPVGDEWIYGVRAVSLLSNGLTEDDLTPYRSGFYFNMVKTWGEETARKREKGYREKHDAARAGEGLPPLFESGASLMIEHA